jgi:hypothetical protein
MVSRPSTPTVLLGIGVLLVGVSAIPVAGSAAPSEFVHDVEPAENDTLAYGIEYEERDVLVYETLSERGQAVFDRARRDSPFVVANESATASDFEYASDHVALGKGVYPVQYDGEVYSLRTSRDSAGYNVAASFLGLASSTARVLGVGRRAAGVLLAGWRRYQY